MADLIVYSDLLNSKNLTEEIEKLTDKLGKDANKRYSKYTSTAKNTLIIAQEKKAKQKAILKKWLNDNREAINDPILVDFIEHYYIICDVDLKQCEDYVRDNILTCIRVSSLVRSTMQLFGEAY